MPKDIGLKSYFDWVNILASILTITSIIVLILRVNLDTTIAVSTICLVSLFLLFENRYLKTNWRRKKKYPNAFKEINEAFFSLNELYRNVTPENKIELKDSEKNFEHFCTSIADAFHLITESKCSVAIKLMENNQDALMNGSALLYTFSRDTKSNMDRKEMPYSTQLTIQNNSDFEIIIERIKAGDRNPFFFSNNLLKELGYKNSRINHSYYDNLSKELNPLTRWKKMENTWPIPYKSTIVVPIISYRSAHPGHPVSGFLCVDSPDKGTFSEEFDIEILFGMADTLYSYLQKGMLYV